jgi:hypothetical protein
MTMPQGTSLPYGLRDVKIVPYSEAGVKGTPIDLPNARTFSFSENEEFQELRGDDRVVASRGQGSTVDWELESGGISLEAYAAINGGTVTVTGVSPAEVKTYSKKTTDAKPRFGIEGQALSESGGDFHCVLTNCKATDGIEGELSDGEFWLTSASGTALGDPSTDLLYEFVQNETATAISTS